jgi:RNA recognition motif-containing protein
MNIFVGNLSPNVTEDDLKETFKAFGQLESVKVIKDRYSGESRGFAFVEMPSKDEATAAIIALNGTDLKGQSLNINEARPRSDNRSGGGRRHGGGGGGRRF